MENASIESPQNSMFNHDHDQVSSLFAALLKKELNRDTWTWLEERAGSKDVKTFNTTFSAVPRKTGRPLVETDKELDRTLQTLLPGFLLRDWTIDRLARVWLIMQMDHSDKEKYFRTIENLFLT